MGDDDSVPSDDPEGSFSSTSEKSDGCSSQNSTPSWSLAKKETKQVNYSKVLLLGVMVIAAAVLGLFTFLVVDEDEDDDFRAAVSSKLYRRLYAHCSSISRSSSFACFILFLLFCTSLVSHSFLRNHQIGPQTSEEHLQDDRKRCHNTHVVGHRD
jgi:hypothetical protein